MSTDRIPEDLINPSGSDGDYLKTVSGQVQWAAAPTGTGSGSGNVHDRRWNVPTGATSIDEFNDETLDPAWVRVDGTGALAANCIWTEGADVLSVKNLGADSSQVIHALLRPISALAPGDGFVTCMTLHGRPGTNHSMAGLILTDGATFGAGAQMAALTYLPGTSTNAQRVDAYSWTNFNTAASSATSAEYLLPFGKLYQRLWMPTANNWQIDTSPDGVTWLKASTLARTLTPTYVGFLSTSYGTTIKHVATYEYLRRYSGIAATA